MTRHHLCALTLAVVSALALADPRAAADTSSLGYYRFPAIHGDTIVFTAEGDLWRVGVNAGVAQRLTTHPSEESRAAISADGKAIAFSAAYEGPTEVYTLAIDGGVPMRQTFEGGNALVVGWSPSGEVPEQNKTDKKDPATPAPVPAAQGVQPAAPAVVDLTGIDMRLLEVPLPPRGTVRHPVADGWRAVGAAHLRPRRRCAPRRRPGAPASLGATFTRDEGGRLSRQPYLADRSRCPGRHGAARARQP